MAALRDADLNLNPIPEKNIIKVPIPKWVGKYYGSLIIAASFIRLDRCTKLINFMHWTRDTVYELRNHGVLRTLLLK